MSRADAIACIDSAVDELREARRRLLAPDDDDNPGMIRIPMTMTLAEAQREVMRQVLAAEGGNRTRAAERLGICRRTLNYWLAVDRDDRHGETEAAASVHAL